MKMNNSITKETIIYQDCVLGDISIAILIDVLKDIYHDINTFEDIITSILKDINFSNEAIVTLLHLINSSYFKLIIDMLDSLE